MIFNIKFASIQDLLYDSISNVSIQSGSNSSFYPNYAPDDAYAVKGRGFYFNSASYLNIDSSINSSIILAPEFTIKIWLFIFNDGIIFTRKNSSQILLELKVQNNAIQFSLQAYSFANLTAVGELITYNVWHLIEIGTALNGNGEQIIICIDSNQTVINMSYYYVESIYSIITMLGDPISSFQGYIWSMIIYNKQVKQKYSNSADCIYPIELTECLPTCLFNQYMNATCINCSSTCLYSCGFSDSCNLCNDILCEVCINYSYCNNCTMNAFLNQTTGLCQCDYNWTPVIDKCFPCDISCYGCTNISFYNCIGCSTGYLYFSDYRRCLKYYKCPNNYGPGPICTYNANKLIFNVTFDSIQGVFYDSVGGIPVQSGYNGSSYPNYSLNDARAAKNRGVYFTNASFMSIDGNSSTSNIVLAPEFYISVWILAFSDGIIFTRGNTSNILIQLQFNRGVYLFYQQETLSTSIQFSNFNDKQWHIIQIEKLLSGNGEELRLWIDPGYHNIYSLDYFVDQITSIYTTLGSLFNSFEGYLWSLKIVNVAGSEIFITSSSCNYPSSFINCIPSCLFSEYYYMSSCTSCMTACNNSCRFSDSCNLCDDILCLICENYTFCNNCTLNASYNTTSNKCICNQGYASNIDKCQVCQVSCAACFALDYLSCVTCSLGFIYFSDYKRCLEAYACPNSFNYNNNACVQTSNTLIFSVTFDSILEITYDTVGEIPVQSGGNSHFILIIRATTSLPL